MTAEQVFFNVPLDRLKPIFKGWVREVMEEQPKQPAPTKEGYITRNQVCKLLNISLPTVHAWIKQGKLKSYHIGGRTLFKESEVLEAVKPVNYSLK